MWFLECDGDRVFDNKRIWLRPGTQFLLGRTHPKTGSPGFYVEHPSVSRQHLLVAVDNVKPGDSAHLHVKSKLTITDNSKIGTMIDGNDKLSKSATILTRDEHVLKLGNFPDLFRVKWQPTTFSITSLSKALKRADDPLYTFRNILEPLDIKCTGDYITQYTSHLITVKRNTSAVLQALVNGRHVVVEQYLNVLAAAGQKSCAEEQSSLEVDFAANWPRELDYLPPPGKEPFPRPAHSDQFLPNEARADMFGKYTFIFNDQSQHDTLMPVITGGGGKCLVRVLQPGETGVEDMIEFVREVAGKKGDSTFNLTQQVETRKTTAGGIIIMRLPNSKVQMPGYYEKLDNMLGQQSMEQNELLDAILDVDAGKLKREVERVESVDESGGSKPRDSRSQTRASHEGPAAIQRPPADSAMTDPSQHHPTQQQDDEDDVPVKAPSPTPPVRRRAARQRTAQPKFRGFDDFEPEASMQKYEPLSPRSQTPAPEAAAGESQDVDPMEAEFPGPSQSPMSAPQRSSTQRSHTQPSGRKRRGEPLDEERETTQDVVASITKGANAMKKRKVEELERQKASLPVGHEIDMPDQAEDTLEAAASSTAKKPARKKKTKEMDVRALMNERRDADEEARLRDEENLRQALEGMDVADIRNLAKVEEMEIVRRQPPPRRAGPDNDEDGPSDRWDAAWNGRKNFKKFRRQERGSTAARAGYERARTRVIVPLEEVQKKAYGVGEDYWLESVEETQRKEKERRRFAKSQTQSQSQATAGAAGRKLQSQKGRASYAATSPSSGASSDHAGDDVDYDDSEEDDTTRFRRRIRNSRVEDKEVEDAEELYPEEIAGTARDESLRKAAAAATSAKARAKTRGSTQQTQSKSSAQSSAQQSGKRKAAEQGGDAAKKSKVSGAGVSTNASGRASASASVGTKAASNGNGRGKTPVDVDDGDESDEEDPLRFRRRKR